MACAYQNIPACSTSADYAAVSGDRILPFLFELNEADSILNPPEGMYQKFCYNVTASGEDSIEYADLSYFVLGICENITADMLVNITVEINGIPQKVFFGENVELRTLSPDPITGCLGLKFNFPLNKVTGVMKVCFELTTIYPIGPVRVCVKGGQQQVQTGLFICGPACEDGAACNTTVYQRMSVCVPVTVTPWARTGEIVTRCCGSAVVTPGTLICPGTQLQTPCTFTVSRTLCAAIPVTFGANAVPGTPSTNCLGASATQTCADCESDAE